MNEIKIVIDGLNELTQALRALAGPSVQGSGMGQNAAGQAINTSADNRVPVQMGQTSPIQQTMLGQNMLMQQGVSVQQSAPAGGIPTTAAPQEYTIEQLQVAAAGLTSSGKMPQVMGILQNFGIQAMTELRKEQYGTFAAALREAGAQI